eukprot:tig00000053_g23500.t1
MSGHTGTGQARSARSGLGLGAHRFQALDETPPPPVAFVPRGTTAPAAGDDRATLLAAGESPFDAAAEGAGAVAPRPAPAPAGAASNAYGSNADLPNAKWFKAAEDGDTDALRTMLDAYGGQKVDAKGKTIIEKGAFEKKADCTALWLACWHGHEAAARLLLERGADPTLPCDLDLHDKGWHPIHAAASKGHEQIVRLLLDRGARVDAAENTGETPLHQAAEGGHEAVARLLLDRGAPVDAVDEHGRTPLHYAGRWNSEVSWRIMALLLEKGAASDLKDKDGKTAFDRAADSKALFNYILKQKNGGFSPAAVNGVCKAAVKVLGADCSPAAIVDKFPAAKLHCALHLAHLFEGAARASPDQASLLLKRRAEAVDVAFQVLDAMEQAFGKLQVLSILKVEEKFSVEDSVNALMCRLPGVGNVFDIAAKLDLHTFFGHPFVQRFSQRLYESIPAVMELPMYMGMAFFSAVIALVPSLSDCARDCKVKPEYLAINNATGRPHLWWEAKKHLFNHWAARFGADLVTYLIYLLLLALAVSSWVGESAAGQSRLPPLALLAIHCLGMLLSEFYEMRGRGAREYLGDVFNLFDLGLFLTTLAVTALGIVAEVNPVHVHLANNALPLLALLFIPALLRILEFGYISPTLGPMLAVFGRMLKNIFSVLLVFLLVFVSFLFALWGWSASFRNRATIDAEPPITLLETAGSLYFAFLGESDYDLMRTRVPIVGSAFFSIYQIITVILLLNVLTGLFSFSFTAIFENAQDVYALGRAKVVSCFYPPSKLQLEINRTQIVLRYHCMDRYIPPPLNLLWLPLSPAPRLAVAVVNVVSAALALPLLFVATLLSLIAILVIFALQRESVLKVATTRESWCKAFQEQREAELKAKFAKGESRLAVLYDEATKCMKPDPVPSGQFKERVPHTKENVPRNIEILHEIVHQQSIKAMENIQELKDELKDVKNELKALVEDMKRIAPLAPRSGFFGLLP